MGQVTKVRLSCYLVLIAKPGNKTATPHVLTYIVLLKDQHLICIVLVHALIVVSMDGF